MAETHIGVEFPQGVPGDATCFDGHFPDHPIVPGAVLLGYAAKYLSEKGFEIAKVSRMKFQRPLLPNQSFEVKFDIKSDTASVTWSTKESVVATARLALRVHGG